MSHLTGTDRSQLNMFPLSLDEMVGQENPVRVIDLFVNRFDFEKLGFSKAIAAEAGRPPYDPADLMKLYLYGYLNRIRSSRKLESSPTLPYRMHRATAKSPLRLIMEKNLNMTGKKIATPALKEKHSLLTADGTRKKTEASTKTW